MNDQGPLKAGQLGIQTLTVLDQGPLKADQLGIQTLTVLDQGPLKAGQLGIQTRGVEILKYSTCPRASYLKKVTCPDKILLVLFFVCFFL